jgi:hypothetical protein
MIKNRRIARRMAELNAIMARYNESDEAKGLDKRSTADLIQLRDGDSEWLRRPCGDLAIDGALCARCALVGEILKSRGAPFRDGRYHDPDPRSAETSTAGNPGR